MNARNVTVTNSALPGHRLIVGVSCMTGSGIDGAESHVTRAYNRSVRPEEKRGPLHETTTKWLHTSFYGRTFASSDAHSQACLEYGWTARHGRNSCGFVMSRAARKHGMTTTNGMYCRAVFRHCMQLSTANRFASELFPS